MIKINILCLGKLSEKYLVDMENEYLKRLSSMYSINIIELSDERLGQSMSIKDKELIKEKEAKKLLDKLSKLSKSFVIVLDELGTELDSISLSKKINEISLNTSSDITFVIGGSLGLATCVKERANLILSFSKLTFPHQLIRVFLLEQLFRSYKISNNQKYHH